MINYKKFFELLKKKGITSTDIRKQHIISESALQKMRVSCGESFDEVKQKLEDFQSNHPSFNPDVSFKTIEDLCQILQCQPKDILEWKIELNPDMAYSKDKDYSVGRSKESIQKSIEGRKNKSNS